MATDVEITVAMLERSIEEAENKIRGLRAAINTICTEGGLPPRYPQEALAGAPGRAPASGRPMQIQDDTFYGKKQTPAMREYLEMRKMQGSGPATPREIYEALKTGGYQFDAKDEVTALVGLRALLRTQPHVFHKLPQGTYGLTSWYPDPKRNADPHAKRGVKKRKKGVKTGTKSAKAEKTAQAAQDSHAPSLKVVSSDNAGTPKSQKGAEAA